MTQWDGTEWQRVEGGITPVMTDAVRPLLEEAATKYISDKPGWTTQSCG